MAEKREYAKPVPPRHPKVLGLLANAGSSFGRPRGLVLNVAYVVLARPTVARAIARSASLVLLWVAALAFLWWDPFRVRYWWFD